MTNVLIRDIPDDVLAGVDARATRLGSRGWSTFGAGWWPTRRRRPSQYRLRISSGSQRSLRTWVTPR